MPTSCQIMGMLDLIPFILADEISRVTQEIKGGNVFVIFDGTKHLEKVLFSFVVHVLKYEWLLCFKYKMLKYIHVYLAPPEVSE